MILERQPHLIICCLSRACFCGLEYALNENMKCSDPRLHLPRCLCLALGFTVLPQSLCHATPGFGQGADCFRRVQCGHAEHWSLVRFLVCPWRGHAWRQLSRSCCGERVEVPRSAELSAPSTELRPADILTSALGTALTALDVSMCSPHAQGAGAHASRQSHSMCRRTQN